ncbi:cation:proton antiporter [Agrococcus carbonis]|uniref:Potassium/proton antiporter membrane subunit, CPA2 family n=1 Tax=Agrococcus carbonis TaxID=684552 RepID=A0A1H1NRY5_9MICO|nr:cation:proton antiporter [Agrococcus carbonis]SDS01693.1 potassium/proton antiporter membrane subunit, CPA2 family [Agrococcus carbonis]
MHDVAPLLLELGVVVLAVSLLGLLAHRIGISPVPLMLLTGVVLGTGDIVDITHAEPFIGTAAEIGVLLLLLMLGLEFTAEELAQSLARHSRSGLVDMVLNAGAGFAAGLLLGMPLPACLALAGITWVSSSGIVARMLADLGRLGNRETPAVLSILVIEDIAMAIFLPILIAVLTGAEWWQALGAVALALGAVSTILVASRRASARLGQLLSHPSDEQVLLRLLGITLVVAGLTQLLGASAAVGAFLLGIAVPPSLAVRARSILGPLRDLFAAIFFFSFGLPIVAAELLPVLPAALLLAVVTTGTKLATGWFAAGRDGAQRRGRLRAGAALVPRGEFSIVIAALAVSAGHPEVGAVAACYVLLTAIGGPLLARWIVPARSSARPVA